ncbi:anhydro-N-acetylmuramic acid kinase [Ekhidna sp.]|uniref:anhydro-N-acetylmuramic acid kinase n=1 Tax=Ekhidna sp. TaxID=2608089 RepID=UPI00329A3594
MVSQRKDKSFYSVVGVMAGSSMDGLDLAHALFTETNNGWEYQLKNCEVISYPSDLLDRLKRSPTQKKKNQELLDIDFGKWIARCVNNFKKNLPAIDILAVHGHTVIHKPSENISWQLGDGTTIALETGITTITEFRSFDVQNGGQGAPLVPFGDFTLFNEYDACLNLGGIANISLKANHTAWDICPCNQVLNYFAEKLGEPYDKNGDFGKSGKFDEAFYSRISTLPFFSLSPPKSLPNNFIDLEILRAVEPKDGLYTYCQVIAEQIQRSMSGSTGSKLLITGGGAFNSFLINGIRSQLNDWEVYVPDTKLVVFKESLVFAFLALKRMRNEINTLSSVTGASKDTSSGVIHLP